MATAQLNLTLTDQQVDEIVAYLRTLTGTTTPTCRRGEMRIVQALGRPRYWFAP